MIAIIQVDMGHSKDDKAASHERIVAVAAARVRESGTEEPGVAEIMRAAGLTHGGFYKHFASRDDLIAEAVEHALTESEPRFAALAGAEDPLAAFADAYVSTAHRDDRATVTLSAMVGAVMIARALGPTARSDEILRDVREAVRERRLL